MGWPRPNFQACIKQAERGQDLTGPTFGPWTLLVDRPWSDQKTEGAQMKLNCKKLNWQEIWEILAMLRPWLDGAIFDFKGKTKIKIPWNSFLFFVGKEVPWNSNDWLWHTVPKMDFMEPLVHSVPESSWLHKNYAIMVSNCTNFLPFRPTGKSPMDPNETHV